MVIGCPRSACTGQSVLTAIVEKQSLGAALAFVRSGARIESHKRLSQWVDAQYVADCGNDVDVVSPHIEPHFVQLRVYQVTVPKPL